MEDPLPEPDNRRSSSRLAVKPRQNYRIMARGVGAGRGQFNNNPRDEQGHLKNPDGWRIFDKWEAEEEEHLWKRGVHVPLPPGNIPVPRKRLTLPEISPRLTSETRSAQASRIYRDFLPSGSGVGNGGGTIVNVNGARLSGGSVTLTPGNDDATMTSTSSSTLTPSPPGTRGITLRQRMEAMVRSMILSFTS